jgi:hypothetical protein
LALPERAEVFFPVPAFRAAEDRLRFPAFGFAVARRPWALPRVPAFFRVDFRLAMLTPP